MVSELRACGLVVARYVETQFVWAQAATAWCTRSNPIDNRFAEGYRPGEGCLVSIRYMGTKRHMVGTVREAISALQPRGRVVDLFSGMGSVAESLAPDGLSVVTNDALAFTASLSRAKFKGATRQRTAASVAQDLFECYWELRTIARQSNKAQLEAEASALSNGREALTSYMAEVRHVGNSGQVRERAQQAAEATDADHYVLATLYFSAGYMSLEQAIDIDALRGAIDADGRSEDRDWLLGAWIAAISVVLNAPGHTAQHLRPNSDAAYKRMARVWRRGIWGEFCDALERLKQVGTDEWRADNDVLVSDALDLVAKRELCDVGVVYADPPYTKDQYSRFYHLYETLYRYDFPDSNGVGRVRSDRFSTGFSLKSQVRASFHDLCRNVALMRTPLIISYPSNGLLQQTNVDVEEIASKYFSRVDVSSVTARHSTMGASSGKSKKEATENLYVCNW